MNRTKRLLLLASASLLLVRADPVSGQTVPGQTDPAVGVPPLAGAILDALHSVNLADALTVQELATRPAFHDQSENDLQTALDYHTGTGLIRRTGSGTQADPFRYYDQETVIG
jgi:hypothetical protein